MYVVGGWVQLAGLMKAAELNGLVGTVAAFDDRGQRYSVQLDDAGAQPEAAGDSGGTTRAGGVVRVKPAALQLLAVPAADECTVGGGSERHIGQLLEPESELPVGFAIGARVTLVGLVAAAELNGRVGLVTKFHESSQRYSVRLDILTSESGAEVPRVKPANLILQ